MVYRIPAVNLVGRGCLAQLKDEIGTLGCKKALVVSDKFLTENGVVEKVTKVLDQVGIEHTLYNDVKQNPSVANVEGGLEVLKKENCDFIVSIGGGSPQDCGKAISVLATNGGKEMFTNRSNCNYSWNISGSHDQLCDYRRRNAY